MAAKKESKSKARLAEARAAVKKAKAPKKAKAGAATKAASPRTRPERTAGRKTAIVQDLVTRPGGATLSEIMKETGWQKHSVRGFIAGTLKKKLGLDVASTRDEDGHRRYAVVAADVSK